MSSKKKKSSHIFDILRSEFGTPDYGLRQFRKDVAKLKKLGLVSKKTDARKQEATRYMRSLVRSFADVLKGEAQVFSVPRSEKLAYQSAGHRTKGTKVVVTAPKGSKVRRVKPREGVPSYITETPSPRGGKGIRIEHHLFPANTLRSKLASYINRLSNLKKGQYYAFRYRGYMSLRYFSGPDAKKHMLEYLEHYIPDELDEDEAQDYFMQFEFVQIEDTGAWQSGVREQQRVSRETQRSRNRERQNAWRRRKYAEMSELERKEKNEKSALAKQHDKNYHKKKREELKQTNPEAYRAMLEKNAARMRKSRANRKK